MFYPAEAGHPPIGGAGMNNLLATVFIRLDELKRNEQGQDLVEYGLMLSLISLSLISGISGIATAVSHVFSNISTSLA
jgi:Flp pilus assembly pilin Flp